jgi:hypothetical protein
VQRRSPHLLQRSRRVTSSSLASQPQTFASDLGSIRRSCPQAAHFKISSYCPNSSESFSTLNPRRILRTLAPIGCEYPRDNSYSILRTGQLYNQLPPSPQLPGFKYGLGPIEIRPVADLAEMMKESEQRRRGRRV